MNLIYKVIRTVVSIPGGNIDHVIGYARYNTCSDLWGDEVYKDLEMTELHGAYTCSNRYHGREEITLRRYFKGEPDLTMRFCVICECLVTPPFDGYTYHDYDCEMDESCRCDHPVDGPTAPLTMKDVETASAAITSAHEMSDWEHELFLKQHEQALDQYRQVTGHGPTWVPVGTGHTFARKRPRFGWLRQELFNRLIGSRA